MPLYDSKLLSCSPSILNHPWQTKKAISFALVASKTGFISFLCPWTQTGKGHSVYHSMICPVMWIIDKYQSNYCVVGSQLSFPRPLLETTAGFILPKWCVCKGKEWAWEKLVNSFLKGRKSHYLFC